MVYGWDYGLDKVIDYEGFKKVILLCDYEVFWFYVEWILDGEENVLWKGMFKYMVKILGIIFGIKYILVFEEGMLIFINVGRIVLVMYIYEMGNVSWVDGGLIFI